MLQSVAVCSSAAESPPCSEFDLAKEPYLCRALLKKRRNIVVMQKIASRVLHC